MKATEPHATAERLIELEREAAQATRQPAAYTDVTISFSKSISVLHASIRENVRRARLAGDQAAVAYWADREEKFQEIMHGANRAALEYLQAWAGFTRTGYHGVRVDGHEPGRFEEAGLVITSWLQGTSRDGDPQDHIHNQIARITRTTSDGKWRALDTASLRAVLGALQGIAATVVECELTREFSVAWVPRADGRGDEIGGITQAQLDAYSTRTVRVHEKERELARAWERRLGRAPTSRELLYIANDATLQSRKCKDAARVDWDALAARWDATVGGQLAGIAPAVSNARGLEATALVAGDGAEPGDPPSREAQALAVQKALALVSEKQSAWTRHDLLKQLALVMPTETRRMSPQAAQELLFGLAEEASSGRGGDVVCLEAPNGRRSPGRCAGNWTGAASTRGRARRGTPPPRSYRQRRARRARADARRAPAASRARGAAAGSRRELLAAQLRERTQDAREHGTRSGLRLDQAAAVWHVLTSAGPSRWLPARRGRAKPGSAAAARAWAARCSAPRPRRTPPTSSARPVSAWQRTRPGSWLTLTASRRPRDHGGRGWSVSLAHLAEFVEYSARNGYDWCWPGIGNSSPPSKAAAR